MTGLEGRVALVTGATQAMGEAIALHLARRGAVIVGVGRSAERGESVAGRLRAEGFDARFLPTDVSIEEQVAAAVRTIEEQLGRVDIVVNNAAAFDFREGAPHEMTTEAFDSILKVGLYGPFWFAKYAAPVMIRGGRGGSFINISSFAGSLGIAGLPAYSASKGGLEALTRQVAVQYAADRIRANALILGSISVPRNAALHDNEVSAEVLRTARSTERPGTPDDVGAAVAFLAGDEAGFINGACLPVDGGLMAKASHVTTMQAVNAKKATEEPAPS